MTAFIEVSDLTVERRGRALLEGVSLTIARGEVVALLGPNGAGKSTLVRAIAGEISPDRGAVTVAGRPLRELTLRQQARLRAVVPQESVIAFPLAVREVVALGRLPHDDEDGAAIDRALRATDTLALAHRVFGTLSGGERQRVQIARALAQLDGGPGEEGRALLLDEPTASLDLAHRLALGAELLRIAERGVAVLCVVHDFALAADADRVAVLRAGRLVAVGTPGEVLTPSLLADVFDVDAVIATHPDSHRPLVIPRRRVPKESPDET